MLIIEDDDKDQMCVEISPDAVSVLVSVKGMSCRLQRADVSAVISYLVEFMRQGCCGDDS